VVAVAGFLTFGTGSDGFILNNYSPYDPLIAASRGAIATSLVFTYPLPFVGFRDGVLDVVDVPEQDRTDGLVAAVTVALLAIVTAGAWLIRDLALVLSVGGGTFSTAVTAVFPTFMIRSIAFKDGQSNDVDDSISTTGGGGLSLQSEAALAQVLMWVCVGLGATGVFLALERAASG